MTDDNLKTISKNRFKNMVKKSAVTASINHLNKLKNKHSKLDNITVDNLKSRQHPSDERLNISQMKLLFKLRTRMIKVDHNYGKKNTCKICTIGPDDQIHLTKCLFLRLKCPDIQTIDYSDIFSDNIDKLNKVAIAFEKVLREREIFLHHINGD